MKKFNNAKSLSEITSIVVITLIMTLTLTLILMLYAGKQLKQNIPPIIEAIEYDEDVKDVIIKARHLFTTDEIVHASSTTVLNGIETIITYEIPINNTISYDVITDTIRFKLDDIIAKSSIKRLEPRTADKLYKAIESKRRGVIKYSVERDDSDDNVSTVTEDFNAIMDKHKSEEWK